jgi:hypothetical protein
MPVKGDFGSRLKGVQAGPKSFAGTLIIADQYFLYMALSISSLAL